MNENINSDLTNKHNFHSALKEININKNLNLTEVNGGNGIPTRTPLKDRRFNFNVNNSKTPLNKNILNSQIINAKQTNKEKHNQQEIKDQLNESKLKNHINFQSLNSKEKLISGKAENKTKGSINFKENMLLILKEQKEQEREPNAAVNYLSKGSLSDSNLTNNLK